MLFIYSKNDSNKNNFCWNHWLVCIKIQIFQPIKPFNPHPIPNGQTESSAYKNKYKKMFSRKLKENKSKYPKLMLQLLYDRQFSAWHICYFIFIDFILFLSGITILKWIKRYKDKICCLYRNEQNWPDKVNKIV